jgi:hypothetical protein
MGFATGRVHYILPQGPPMGILRFLQLMDQGGSRILQLATVGGGDMGNPVTIEVQFTTMTGVQYDTAEFPVDAVYTVVQPQWIETVGVRFTGQIIGAHAGVVTRVQPLDAPRDVTGYIELDSLQRTQTIWLQLVAHQPPAEGEITVTPLVNEFE